MFFSVVVIIMLFVLVAARRCTETTSAFLVYCFGFIYANSTMYLDHYQWQSFLVFALIFIPFGYYVKVRFSIVILSYVWFNIVLSVLCITDSYNEFAYNMYMSGHLLFSVFLVFAALYKGPKENDRMYSMYKQLDEFSVRDPLVECRMCDLLNCSTLLFHKEKNKEIDN